jgi:hypothetical protein
MTRKTCTENTNPPVKDTLKKDKKDKKDMKDKKDNKDKESQ